MKLAQAQVVFLTLHRRRAKSRRRLSAGAVTQEVGHERNVLLEQLILKGFRMGRDDEGTSRFFGGEDARYEVGDGFSGPRRSLDRDAFAVLERDPNAFGHLK